MARYAHVPGPTIRRLSLYLRELEGLLAEGRETVSSKQLGQALRVTDAQVRKDLAYFGQLGRPGVGYPVDPLIREVRGILGTDRLWPAVLVGAGNLGRALAAYRGFARRGFQIVAVFDSDPAVVGQGLGTAGELTVLPMSQLPQVVRSGDIRIGIIAVPAPAAQNVAEQMLDAGIRALLTFAPAGLDVPHRVPVVSADLAIHLEQLAFQVAELAT